MNFKYYFPGIIVSCSFLAFCSCEHKRNAEATRFTKIDSLTETYLELKDSMLETWNTMINDDNQKIKSMHNLLHELKVSDPAQRKEFAKYEERLDQLENSRYTQKSMENTQLIEEYDFASNSLVTELISLAESQAQFAYNSTLQKLVEAIRTADQRVDNYREEYDRIATKYNRFIDEHKPMLKEIDDDTFLEKKPLFQMVAEE
jgi:septal ring factor EnvC (AmiA/AmiB activator)